MFRHTQSRAHSANAAKRRRTLHPGQRSLRFETLEDRRLLAGIAWINRGQTSDGFADVFGANAAAARNVVDAALTFWNRSILNFNQEGGVNQLDVTIQMEAGNESFGGSGGIDTLLGNKPRTGTISLGRGNDTTGDGKGDGGNWYLDPTPYDGSEYQGDTLNGFAGLPTPGGAADGKSSLFSLVVVEMAHVLGMDNRFEASAWNQDINSYLSSTGQADVRDSPGLLWTFTGPSGNALLTTNNGGGGGMDTGYANHVAFPPNVYFGYIGVADCGTAGGDSAIRYIPSKLMVNMLKDMYGYTVQDAYHYGTYYDTLDNSGKLRIVTPGSGNDQVSISSSGGIVTVNLVLGSPVLGADPTTITSIFDSSAVSSIEIDTGEGSDTITLGAFSGTVKVFGGPGAGVDSLIINNATGNNTLSFVGLAGGSHNISLISGIENLTINGSGGNENFYVNRVSGFTSLVVNGGDGGDTCTLANGDLTVSIPSQFPFVFNGGTGNDRIVIENSTQNTLNWNHGVYGSYVDAIAAGYYLAANYTSADVTINGSMRNDTFVLGAGSSGNSLLNGNDGDDNAIVGGGNMTGIQPQNFNGGNGNDQITFDNHLDATNRIWDMRNNEIFFGGLIVLSTASFESVGVLGGSGQDEFDFQGVLGQSFNVDGGPNADDFVLGYQGSVFFSNPVTLLGGTGADLFTVNDAAVSAFTTPLVMDGGAAADFNGLVVNEPLATGYYLGPGYFTPRTGASDLGTFSFVNMLATVITGTSGDNDFTIYSAGVSLGTFTINGGSGNDSFVLAPQLSGYSFKGLTINGQPGTDTFTLDAGGLFTDESYTIGTNTLTIARGGVDFDTVTITSMDSVTLNCGLGNDTIYMSQYSAGIPVTVNGGIGDDTMNVGGGDLPANVTNIAAFNFSGQTGHDTFNLNNGNRTDQWSYTNNTATIQASDVSTGYFIGLGLSAVEQLNVNAGSGIDVMTLTAVPSGETLAFNGGSGGNALNLPPNLATVLGPVFFDGGGDANINQLTNSSATPAVVHVDQTSVGAFAGDTFFPAGASLHFQNVSNMTLTMGSGEDTVYAQPNATATVNIRGGNPTTAPGDTLNLDLTNAVNYVITPTSPTSGNVTSDNLQTLTFSGFETIPNAPQFVDAISFTGAYSQNFDTLPTSGSTLAWSNNSTLSGWSLYRQPATGTAITTIDAGTGSSTTGSFYSFGVLGSGPLTDRALGGLASGGTYFGGPLIGAAAGWIALGLTNDTGAEIGTLSLGYDSEQWRDGGNTSPQTMTLEYGFGNSFTTVPTWTAPGGSFDFTSPIHTATAAALDGNAASNRTSGLGGTLNNLGWTAGNTLWVRWVESNDAGNDHALAIDNVQIGLPAAFFGDFNADGSNDAADYTVWRNTFGSSVVPAYSGADGDGDGTIDQDDYGVWRAHFGEILLPPGSASGMGAVAAGTADAGGQSEIGASFATLAQPLAHDGQLRAESSEPEISESSEMMNSATVAHVSRSVLDAVGERIGALRPGMRRATTVESRVSANRHDAALMTWLSTVWDQDSPDRDAGDGNAQDRLDSRDSVFESFNGAFADFGYDVTRSDLLASGAARLRVA